MTLSWMFALPFVAAVGCVKHSSSHVAQTDPLNLIGQTGRNLTITVDGLRKEKSENNVHTICGMGLAGNESSLTEFAKQKLVCESQVNSNEQIKIRLKDLPYPTYITLFHDQNNNRVLDFSELNVVLVHERGPAEGIGVLDSDGDTPSFSRPIWVEVGEQSAHANIVYEDSPLSNLVKKYAWGIFFSWYKDFAFKLNNPGKKKSPFPETSH